MRTFNVNVNGKQYVVQIEETDQPSAVPKEAAPVAPQEEKTVKPAGKTEVKAPMPGTILDVKAQKGDRVKAGDVICILEAMKMENEMTAPCDGTVVFTVAKGASVNTGDVLAVLN